jgi:two-component system KDP operon response regulator KdpE
LRREREEAKVTAKVLLVDHDLGIVRDVQPVLAREGYQVDHALPEGAAIRRIVIDDPDLLIVGVDEGTWGFCRQLLTVVDQPVLLLLNSQDKLERVKGLDLGADDCMAKPVHLVELVARVRALLRRTANGPGRERRYLGDGDLVVDLGRREVRVANRVVTLTPTELRLLSCLVRHMGQVVSQERLVEVVWGAGQGGSADLVKQYVFHLRQKLETDPHQPRRILTRWGEGYLLQRIEATGLATPDDGGAPGSD